MWNRRLGHYFQKILEEIKVHYKGSGTHPEVKSHPLPQRAGHSRNEPLGILWGASDLENKQEEKEDLKDLLVL